MSIPDSQKPESAVGNQPPDLATGVYSLPQGEWNTVQQLQSAFSPGNPGIAGLPNLSITGQAFNSESEDDEIANAVLRSLAKYSEHNPSSQLTANTLSVESGLSMPGATQDLLYRQSPDGLMSSSDDRPTPMDSAASKPPASNLIPADAHPKSDAPPGQTSGDKTTKEDGTDKPPSIKVDITNDDEEHANLVFNEKGELKTFKTNDDKETNWRNPQQGDTLKICVDRNTSAEGQQKILDTLNKLSENSKVNLTLKPEDFKAAFAQPATGTEQSGGTTGGGSSGSGGESSAGGGGQKSCSGPGCEGGQSSGDGQQGGTPAGGDNSSNPAGGSNGESPSPTGNTTTGEADRSKTSDSSGGKATQVDIPQGNLSKGITDTAHIAANSETQPVNQQTVANFVNNFYSRSLQQFYSRYAAVDLDGDGKISDDERKTAWEKAKKEHPELTAEDFKKQMDGLEAEKVNQEKVLDDKVKEMSAESPAAAGALSTLAGQIKDHSPANKDFQEALTSLAEKRDATPMNNMEAQQAFNGILPRILRESKTAGPNGKPLANPVIEAAVGRALNIEAAKTVDEKQKPATKADAIERSFINAAKTLQEITPEVLQRIATDADKAEVVTNVKQWTMHYLQENALKDFGFAADEPAPPTK